MHTDAYHGGGASLRRRIIPVDEFLTDVVPWLADCDRRDYPMAGADTWSGRHRNLGHLTAIHAGGSEFVMVVSEL